MSLNRFLLAALSASLPHTIDADEYMVANSVVPTVGPAGVLVGRRGRDRRCGWCSGDRCRTTRPTRSCSCVAAAGVRAQRRAGPADPPAAARAGRTRTRPSAGDVVARAGRGARATCGSGAPAGLGLLTIGAHRIVYGVVTVATILVYRNYFHTLDRRRRRPSPTSACSWWSRRAASSSRPRSPRRCQRAARRPPRGSSAAWSARRSSSCVPGAIYAKVPLLVAAFLLGLTAQNIKICVDTLVQAHVDDEFKGRVFVLYDMIFNVALVLAAVIGALSCPPTACRCPILVVLAACYLADRRLVSRLLSRHLDWTRARSRCAATPRRRLTRGTDRSTVPGDRGTRP